MSSRSRWQDMVLISSCLWGSLWWSPFVGQVTAQTAPRAVTSAATSPAGSAAESNRAGLEKRPLWTTSRVVGYPEPPPPFVVQRVFSRLSLRMPVQLLQDPLRDRLLVVEQRGTIRSFLPQPSVGLTKTFLEVTNRNTINLVFHPQHAKNHFVYVFSFEQVTPEKRLERITRYTVQQQEPFACDPASALDILTWDSQGHNGGGLVFGPDGFLYIGVGDGSSDSDGLHTGQDISDLLASILRIDVDHPSEIDGKPQHYSIPADNPFRDLKTARPEIWAYGVRNPWRMHFDPQGNLWCGDVGQDQWEHIEIVRRGDNFGWSVMEGNHEFQPLRKKGPHPFTRPLIEHPHSEARAIIGGVTYQGERFPELRGAYIYGDHETGKIWAAKYQDGKLTFHKEIADTPHKIISFATNRRGELYILDYLGPIYTLEPNRQLWEPDQFPKLLSQTGLFDNVGQHNPAPGVIPYEVNSPLWSDGAFKARFVAVPGNATIDFAEQGAWKFPEKTVLVKSFALEKEANNPATRKWIETRLLVYQQGEWVGYSYVWNDTQSDATLVAPAGEDRQYDRPSTPAEPHPAKLAWRFPSRAECMVCHSRASGFVLGLTTLQMHRDCDYSSIGGRPGSQLRTLGEIGLLRIALFQGRNPDASDWDRFLSAQLHLVDPYVSTAQGKPVSLELRARSYLHANCAQCHLESGGGNSAMELRFRTPLGQTKLINAVPIHDRFGIPDAKLVTPGQPEKSVLMHRVSTLGRGRMPPLASTVVDDAGVQLLREWIRQLPPPAAP